MPEFTTYSSKNPHLLEHPSDEARQITPFEKGQINLNLGFLATTGELPEDSTYSALKDNAREAKKWEYEATHDSLTGLLNGVGFEAKFNEVMAEAQNDPKACYALVVFDFDGFKEINDTHGHGVGNNLIEGVGKRWARSIHFRDKDVFARLHGDEFALLLDTAPEGNEKRRVKTEVEAIKGGISHAKTEALTAGEQLGLKFRGVSAGYAICEPGKSFEESLAEADALMYKDKATRRVSQ